MLHYFPEPYPGELFLSIVARYGERLRLWRRQQVQEQLFGRGNIAISVEMPRALEALVERLPTHSRLKVDDLIDKHTLLGLYAPFMDLPSRDFARRAMCGNEVRDVMAALGRNVKVQPPDWLKFCPVCWKQDKQAFGEAFWHRSHQASGVEVCLKHLVFLETSKAPRGVPTSRYTLNTAKMSCFDVDSRAVHMANQHHCTLLDLARDVTWLLEENNFFPDPHTLQRRYIDLLLESGFIASVHKIHYDPLRNAIRSRFSDAILQSLNCSLPENSNYQWIKRLIRQDVSILKHPLQHLVLIRTLGFSVRSFFDLLREMPTKFGKGPWPCNNPVCSDYRRRVIARYNISRNSNSKKTRGIFCCTKCGYAYSAVGILDSISQPFTIGRCHGHGDLWRQKLASLWHDENNNLSHIGRLLGISIGSLLKHAVQQGLPLRKCDTNNKNQMLVSAAIARADVRAEHVQEHRRRWLELRKVHPEASIKQLEQLPNSPIRWLRSYDFPWLLENRPAPRRRGRSLGDHYTLEDWTSRDQSYLLQIEQVALAVKQRPGRPVRVSISAICRAISIDDAKSLLAQHNSTDAGCATPRIRPLRAAHITNKSTLRNLPLTEKVLRQVLESALEFARRRLVWAVDECQKNSRDFTRYQLEAMAGVRTLINKNPRRLESVILRTLIDELCRTATQTSIVSPQLGQ